MASKLTEMSDEEILNFINGKYSPGDSTAFDVGDLFTITKTIIDHATRNSMVDDILKSANALNEKVPNINDSFISPLCTLKSICCEMSSCMDKACSGEEISIQPRTEVIFDKLKPYPWDAKAVLALAAFALEYGDFWHLAQLYGQCNQLTNSLAILKRVPVLTKHAILEKRKEEVLELNHLIKATLQVTDFIFKVEDLFVHNHNENVKELDKAVKSIPTYVFWTITTIVACAVKVTHLTSDEEEPYPLSYLVTKIEGILKILEEQHASCEKELDKLKKHRKLVRIMSEARSTHQIMNVINTLIQFRDDGKLPTISVGSSVKEDNYVLFYISSLENNKKDDISHLKEVHDQFPKKYKNWTIVWIPIVEDWTEDHRKKFEELASEMPWYKVQFFSSIVIKFLSADDRLSFKGNPKCVVMSPQAQLQSHNTLDLIRKYGINFFDHLFPVVVPPGPLPVVPPEDPRLELKPFFESLKNEELKKLSKDKKTCIFFFGGTVESWIKLEKNVKEVNDTVKVFGVAIELSRVVLHEAEAGESKYSETHEAFWSGIENLLLSLLDHYNEVEYKIVKAELHKLLSYKHGEWIMVSQKYELIASCRPATIFDVLENMSQSKPSISLLGSYIQNFIANKPWSPPSECCQFVNPGNPPKIMDCPFCRHPMETISVAYKCCHPGYPHN
ncbi:putative sieve element occlusion [Rosa chinensis]|uniref:Putative sieve element occlusion n=1 Tax=Rosa chinensis TaxID=74649 RepID=A0A2P6QQ50_ROSCH|nr:putative sieve element occlusion [Rosa chinensis]